MAGLDPYTFSFSSNGLLSNGKSVGLLPQRLGMIVGTVCNVWLFSWAVLTCVLRFGLL